MLNENLDGWVKELGQSGPNEGLAFAGWKAKQVDGTFHAAIYIEPTYTIYTHTPLCLSSHL